MSPFFGELIGTMILIILGAGVCAGVSLKKTFSNSSGWIVIAMGWAMAVAIAVYAVGGISGAHLNPAVTLGLASIGKFPWADVPSYILAQFLGAILGATFVWVFYYPHWKATEDAGTKLGVFSTGPAIKHTVGNLISEILGTFILVFGILSIGANKFAEGLNPLIVGFLILAIGLSLGGVTGYAINPARDLGPRIAHAILPIFGKGSSNWGYAWIPVVGPIIGGIAAAQFFKIAAEGNDTWTAIILAAFFVVALGAGIFSGSSGSSSPQKKSSAN
ncbi:MIP/aquaporin family protein [Paenibacillus sediminis]|uniref:Glycerol uptake facilitator protein n=1 Tax=Paenibacillus sediminis TaxID=664909 RepID=A0ABS4H2N8_9BACL|nr:MIP/aquaporin family protein [Paenibacillus sediminis]MBP1936784.1 glycerol uptake facilitator protein [Paenibacillus sediminis]